MTLSSAFSHARLALAFLFASFTATFFLWPGFALVSDLMDPATAGPGISSRAWTLHSTLSPRIATWARSRVESGRAGEVQMHDVATTEWPMFTAVFYLLATEALQDAWEQESEGPEPAVYAREAIDASRDLIVDPVHHSWVQWHWGDRYLHEQNVFFRSLLISGLTSHESLIGDGSSVPMLRDQVETLADELDRSELGVLNDYPGQCYPLDVVAAIGWIRHADTVLGTDHSAFVERSVRGFTGKMADSNGLVPYQVDRYTGGQRYGPARGIGNSWVALHAPDLWPELAPTLYAAHEKHYWRDMGWAAGFREFLPSETDHWQEDGEFVIFEIDAGPVVAGFGTAASAFGIAAARRNGRFDHAYILTSQLAAVSWSLPDGTLALPRLVSEATEAPHLGEAAILYFLTVTPADGVPIVTGGRTPWLVWVAMLVYFGVGGSGPAMLAAMVMGRRRRARQDAGLASA